MFPKLNFYLVKIERFSAWILLLGMLAYFISGYGMTRGIIDTQVAKVIHLNILPLTILLAFVFHVSLAIRMALIRWRLWNWFLKIILILVFLTFTVAFIYVDLFYQKDDSQVSPTSVQTVTNSNSEETSTKNDASINSTTEKVFTAEELAKYNGENGQPAYVAVDGAVYNLSDVFVNGTHYGYEAGQDLTNAFFKCHIKSQITKYPVVGKLQ